MTQGSATEYRQAKRKGQCGFLPLELSAWIEFVAETIANKRLIDLGVSLPSNLPDQSHTPCEVKASE